MIVKKLAIASAIALVCMSAAQAQSESTPTENGTTDNAEGLMTALTDSLTDLFNAGRFSSVTDQFAVGQAAVYSEKTPEVLGTTTKTRYRFEDGNYVRDVTGTFTIDTPASQGSLISTTLGTLVNPVDITALAGAVNLSTINGSIDISGTNVSITGVAGEVSAKAEAIGETTSDATSFAINGSNYATTVIGAMNSSTLDVMGRTINLSEMTKSVNNMGVLSTQGLAVNLGSVAFTSDDLGLETSAGDILDTTNIGSIGGEDNTQFNMQDLVSGTDSLASSMTEELQTMAVFNMALNAAPIVAGVKIAAIENTEAWFLNPQTGILNLSNMQITTTAIGAMNSSITRLGANLANLAE